MPLLTDTMNGTGLSEMETNMEQNFGFFICEGLVILYAQGYLQVFCTHSCALGIWQQSYDLSHKPMNHSESERKHGCSVM